MHPYSLKPIDLDPQTRDFYCQALGLLNQAKIPVLIGGGYAFQRYTGIIRQTKDLDLFIRPEDCQPALDALAKVGYETEVAVSHWLAKAFCGDSFVDLIFNSSTGYCQVDDSWFTNAVADEVLEMPVLLCPIEEMIWLKAYVMARDRYDGADVAHLLLTCSDQINWSRLLRRFGAHWRVLFSHLVLFGFSYPGERSRIPTWLMSGLTQRLQQETMTQLTDSDRLCQGTLLAPMQYQIDVEQWGYHDARIYPQGNLSTGEVAEWINHLQQEHNQG